MKLAFIGLGVMGYPMAGHLARAGHQVGVYNRSPEKALRWSEAYGGRACSSAADAAEGAEIALICVGGDADVRALAPTVAEALASGGVIVDHTTTSAILARDMAQACAPYGVAFVDAPVSGGQSGAEHGRLSIMAGGEQSAFDRVTPILAVYARSVLRMGEVGAGQLTKMVNQIAIAGVVQGLAEAMCFTRHAGLDPDLVLEAIGKGAAQSWQMDNRWPTMARGEFDFGFAVDWMRKDLGFALAEAERSGARLELTALVDRFYAEVQAMGGGRWDTSSLAARLS